VGAGGDRTGETVETRDLDGLDQPGSLAEPERVDQPEGAS
jgi:hypothetical protein